jgi:predicted amidophosphoribosyltransferase
MGSVAPSDHLFGACLRNRPLFSTAFTVTHYQEAVTNLLHGLKYQGERDKQQVL